MGVDLSQDLHAFFQSEVARAIRSLAVLVAAPTEAYLANLLASAVDKVDEYHTPFVEQYAQAISAGQERMARMRDVGDAALVVAGFFADSLERRGVTRSYVAAIGTRAYGTAAQLTGASTFADLAQRFGAFTRVLDEVREQTSLCTPADLLQLYERWLRTGSAEIGRRLARQGVAPVKSRASS